MLKAIEQALSGCRRFGQIAIRKLDGGGFVLTHRDDESRNGLEIFRQTEDAISLSKFDDAGNYRPLKTAPNLRHGWRMELVDLSELAWALDYFYPGRLSIFAAWKENRLATTPLRATLDRQSGMYRVAGKISDEQINDLVGTFCRSNGGCLRTILWRRDQRGAVSSTKLPPEKFEASHDQAEALSGPRSATATTVIPLLCQEPCHLLVNECRRVVKSETRL